MSQPATDDILRYPLAPDTLTRLDKLADFPSQPFDPSGSWTHCYRYEVCGGRTRRQWNPAMGWLRITRLGGGNNCTLEIEDHLQFQGSQQHRAATIHYSADGIARPADWDYKIYYLDQNGRRREELSLHQKSVYDGQAIISTINGKQSVWKTGGDLTCNWGLFERVQRLPRDPLAVYRFPLLESLQTVKANHRLSYAGVSVQPWGDRSVKLHQFRQFGSGIGPTEYWLTEQSRLVLVTSMTLACVYDPAAVQRAEQDAKLVVKYE